MAVELKEPALRLMTFIENNRQPEIAERFIGDLVSRPLAEIAADPYVADTLKPLLAQHERNIETMRTRRSRRATSCSSTSPIRRRLRSTSSSLTTCFQTRAIRSG
jgi:hypothetical protein